MKTYTLPQPEVSPEEQLMSDIQQALDTLRDAGYVVVAFSPEEMGEASERDVEDRMTERGWDVIHDQNPALVLYEILPLVGGSFLVSAPGRAEMDEAVDGTGATWVTYDCWEVEVEDYVLPADFDEVRAQIQAGAERV